MAARIRDINPACQLTVLTDFLTPDNIPTLLPPDVDFVIDCIDSLNCKVALIVTARERGLPVAASMGAGNKLDVTRVRVSDISQTNVDTLARIVRKRLRKRGVSQDVLCVWTDEPGAPPLPPETVNHSHVVNADLTGFENLSGLYHGRARAVNGTISYMPPLFGLMLAGAVVKRLLQDQPLST
jgi:tRNA A37 threonylcarbamoyladenosine dehydratase